MKRDQLEKKLASIGKRIERSNVIRNVIELTKKRGEYKTDVQEYHVRVDGSFSGIDYLGKEVKIKYKDGLSMFGGGTLRVSYDGEIVLDADRCDRDKSGLTVKANDFYIQEFHPGTWQKQIRVLIVKGTREEKEKREEEPDVALEDLEIIAKRFSKWM